MDDRLQPRIITSSIVSVISLEEKTLERLTG